MLPRVLFAVLFIVAGTLHFVATPVYVSIMPPQFAHPRLLVQISGVCEVLGGIGLLVPFSRQAAAWGLIALLVCVLPANVHMAIHAAAWPKIPAWMLWARLPLQLPLMYWAWVYTRNPPI